MEPILGVDGRGTTAYRMSRAPSTSRGSIPRGKWLRCGELALLAALQPIVAAHCFAFKGVASERAG